MNRKKALFGLLLISSLICMALLVNTESLPLKIPPNSDELESLIYEHFEEFGVSRKAIRRVNLVIDSTFTRSVYTVRVAPSFPKTSFHLSLHKTLYGFGISSPARVHIPDSKMNIHLSRGEFVEKTISIISDTSIEN